MAEDIQRLKKIKRDVLYGHDISPPQVDRDRCKGCGQCVKVCPNLVFELREKKSEVIHGEMCIACGHCWAVCPEEAVTQPEVTTDNSLKPRSESAVSAEALQLLLRERRSIRLFKDESVSREQLHQIIEAGRYSPTASNRQDVNFFVLSDQEKVAELRSFLESFLEKTFKLLKNPIISWLYSLYYNRSLVAMMQYYDMQYGLAKENKKNAYFPLPFGPAVLLTYAQSFDPNAQFNCSIALYNSALMAHSMGFGTCFLGFVLAGANMDKKIKQFLKIPKKHQVFGAMVLGRPDVKYHRLIERRKPKIIWI